MREDCSREDLQNSVWTSGLASVWSWKADQPLATVVGLVGLGGDGVGFGGASLLEM